MKKSVGSRIAWENLQAGERYILRTGSGEALVLVNKVDPMEIDVKIEQGQIKSVKQWKTYRKGDYYLADPACSEWFDPAV